LFFLAPILFDSFAFVEDGDALPPLAGPLAFFAVAPLDFFDADFEVAALVLSLIFFIICVIVFDGLSAGGAAASSPPFGLARVARLLVVLGSVVFFTSSPSVGSPSVVFFEALLRVIMLLAFSLELDGVALKGVEEGRR
jgi:hypothetical protein